jgi:hypothetical protein
VGQRISRFCPEGGHLSKNLQLDKLGAIRHTSKGRTLFGTAYRIHTQFSGTEGPESKYGHVGCIVETEWSEVDF